MKPETAALESIKAAVQSLAWANLTSAPQSGAGSLHFPRGVIGFEHHLQFECQLMSPLMKLVAREPSLLCFYSLSIEPESQTTYETEDICQLYEVFQLKQGAMGLMVFVSGEKQGTNLLLRANLRAPIVIDHEKSQAWQHVFPHAKYPIRGDLGIVHLTHERS